MEQGRGKVYCSMWRFEKNGKKSKKDLRLTFKRDVNSLPGSLCFVHLAKDGFVGICWKCISGYFSVSSWDGKQHAIIIKEGKA